MIFKILFDYYIFLLNFLTKKMIIKMFSTGADGPEGDKGQKGEAGMDGLPGFPGRNLIGQKGHKGEKGNVGLPGEPGVGAIGKTAKEGRTAFCNLKHRLCVKLKLYLFKVVNGLSSC